MASVFTAIIIVVVTIIFVARLIWNSKESICAIVAYWVQLTAGTKGDLKTLKKDAKESFKMLEEDFNRTVYPKNKKKYGKQ